jgi:uncharacterized protein (DUF1697 family)
MERFIVLLRGINVGGHNLMPMTKLKTVLAEAGLNQVQTYIQTGNLIITVPSSLDAAILNAQISNKQGLEQQLSQLMQASFGFIPSIMVLTDTEFCTAVDNNPYKGHEPKTVHCYFCQDVSALNTDSELQEKLARFAKPSEAHQLIGKVFYIHAPEGIGRSKLVANVEACLGVRATGRNLNTVIKLNDMISKT